MRRRKGKRKRPGRRPASSRGGFSLVEALVGLAILALALAMSLAVTFRLSRHLERLAAHQEANRTVESILESVRARQLPPQTGYRKWERPLGTETEAAEQLGAWVEVAETETPDLYLISVLARYKVLDEPRTMTVQTQVFWP